MGVLIASSLLLGAHIWDPCFWKLCDACEYHADVYLGYILGIWDDHIGN